MMSQTSPLFMSLLQKCSQNSLVQSTQVQTLPSMTYNMKMASHARFLNCFNPEVTIINSTF